MADIHKAILKEHKNSSPLEEPPYNIVAKRLKLTVDELSAG